MASVAMVAIMAAALLLMTDAAPTTRRLWASMSQGLAEAGAETGVAKR